MSEFKGTPGPWLVGKHIIGSRDEFGFNRHIVSMEWKDEQGIADARLIAASPDLLEALKALMDIETADVDMDEFYDGDSVGAYQDESGGVKDLPLTFGHLRRARAAIAKALGQ